MGMVRRRGALVVIRIASGLVPRPLRADWVREWSAELEARNVEGRSALGPVIGTFRHAAWLRRRDLESKAGHVLRDFRHAIRTLRRRPLYATSAIITLALGLAATTVVYTVVSGVLLRPLPYPGGERFVKIETRTVEYDARLPVLSVELFTEWRDRANGFDAIEAYVHSDDTHFVGAGAPAVVNEARVSAGFLGDLLDARPSLGRLFDEEESSGEGRRVALISERLWRERFAGRSDVVGAVVRIDGRESEIIGVLPRVTLLPQIEVWTPLRLVPDHSRSSSGALRTIGRMAPGITIAKAQAALEAAHAAAQRIHPRSMSPFAPVIQDYRNSLVGEVRTHLLLLMGAVVLVLLLACANVTNLILSRGAERSHEFAIRTSLGASRTHIVGQVLVEGLALSLAGGLIGVLLAGLSLEAVLKLLPEEIPLSASIRLDRDILSFALLVSMGVGALVGLAPAIVAAERPSAVRATSRGSLTRGQRRTSNVLLGLEVAQAAALLIGAGLMVNTLLRMATARTGFDVEGLSFAHLELPGYAYGETASPGGRAVFLERLRQRLSSLPGVRSVGIASATPFSGITFLTAAELEGGTRPGATDGGLRVLSDGDDVFFSRLHIDQGYLAALGLPLVSGRSLRPDDLGGTPVALINETAAHAFWPGESPLGKRIRENGPPAALPGGAQWTTIVGVVADFHHPGLPTQGLAELYLPLTQAALPTLIRPTLIVRRDSDDDSGVEMLRREIWALDPELPIPTVSTARTFLGASLAVPRFYSMLLSFFALLALVLAGVGVYGVVAHSVARRTREIGIRLALGAPASSVGAVLARDGLVAVLAGLAIGLIAGMVSSRLLAGLLYGVEPADPVTAASVGLVLLLVAGVAIALPAVRAMRANPIASLRID